MSWDGGGIRQGLLRGLWLGGMGVTGCQEYASRGEGITQMGTAQVLGGTGHGEFVHQNNSVLKSVS